MRTLSPGAEVGGAGPATGGRGLLSPEAARAQGELFARQAARKDPAQVAMEAKFARDSQKQKEQYAARRDAHDRERALSSQRHQNVASELQGELATAQEQLAGTREALKGAKDALKGPREPRQLHTARAATMQPALPPPEEIPKMTGDFMQDPKPAKTELPPDVGEARPAMELEVPRKRQQVQVVDEITPEETQAQQDLEARGMIAAKQEVEKTRQQNVRERVRLGEMKSEAQQRLREKSEMDAARRQLQAEIRRNKDATNTAAAKESGRAFETRT